MAGGLFSNFPSRENLVAGNTDTKTEFPWRMAFRWLTWMRDLAQAVDANIRTTATVGLTNQNASITTTAFSTAALAPGLYRVTWYEQVTTPAGTTSSLTFVLGWTLGAVAQSFTDTAMAGNSTTTNRSNTQTIHIDEAAPITYATTYASNPASAMKYSLDVVLETVDA